MAHDGHAQSAADARADRRKTILRVVSACVIGAFVALIYPRIFGEEYATRQMARVVAPFVGAFYKSAAVHGHRITVLLVDDLALSEAGETWPPSYTYYAKILSDVAKYKPKAVFVDLIFSAQRDDAHVEALQKVLAEMKKGGIKVFLAASLDDKNKLHLRKELDTLATKVAVEYNPDDLDHVVWTYPMTQFRPGDEELESADQNEDATAADDVRAHATTVTDKREDETKAQAVEGQSEPARSAALAIYEDVVGVKVQHPREALALTWGLFPVRDGLRWTTIRPHEKSEAAGKDPQNPEDFDDNYDLYCNESEHAVPLIFGAISHALVAKRGKPVCVFHHTLYQREMLYPNESQNSRLNGLLRKSIVMIGGAFRYSNDVVFSPLQDRVPGVYLHAMALDNLITGESTDYARELELDEIKATGPYLRALLLLLLAGLCVAGLTWLKVSKVEGWKEKCRRPRNTGGRLEIDETLIATARDPDAEANSAGAVTMAVHVHTEAAREPRESFSDRFFDKLTEGAALSFLKAAEVSASLVVVCLLLFVGHWLLNVPYLTIVHVTLFALAAEWLEWNKHLVDWLFGEEKKS